MSKMVDKDELEFMRKMAKEGNLESKLSNVDDAVGRVAGVDFPRGTSPAHTDVAIKRRVLESMRRPKGFKLAGEEAMAEGLEGLLRRASAKGAGKATAILGPLGLLLSEGVEASDVGEPREIEDRMLEKARLIEMNKDPLSLESLQQKQFARSQEAMGRNQDLDEFIKYKNRLDADIANMDLAEKEIQAEVRESKPTKESARNALKELTRMQLEKGLLK